MEFKDRMASLTHEEIISYYKNLSDVHIERETDLNRQSVSFILENIQGKKVLDIACGRGYLAKKIVERWNAEVVGIDFIVADELKDSENPSFIQGDIEEIPYPDKYFDTVICAHTLEHVIDIQRAISELRRVCKKQLIIVLPKQREYKYTFDLHVHFFPYQYTVLNLFKNDNGKCVCVNNDWVYYEEVGLNTIGK